MLLARRPRFSSWRLAATALVAATLACASDPTPPKAVAETDITISATLTPEQQAVIKALSVEVTGAGISTPIVVTLDVTGATVNGTVRVPVGTGRVFTVRAFDAQGHEVGSGSTTSNVVAGTNPTVTVPLVVATATGDVPIDVTVGTYGVTLTPPTASVAVGGEVTLTASVTANGTTIAGPLTWGVVNPALVTVTVAADGRSAVVRGNVAGSTRVVASYQGTAAASTITVTTSGGGGGTNQQPTVGIKSSYVAFVGQPLTISATGSDPDGTIVEYTWIFSSGERFSTSTGSLTHTFASAGQVAIAVAVTDDGGALSRSATTIVYIVPPPASGFTVASVYAGGAHSCALTTGGLAYCWGYADYGQLGNGARGFSTRPVPVAMPTGVTFTSMQLGSRHSCGITSAGAVWCWGANEWGQLGDGTTTEMQMTPKLVGTWESYSVGDDHGCGAQGGVYKCWGHNESGQVRSASGNVATPVTLTPPAGYSYVDIVAGSGHSCAIIQATSSQATPQRRVQCWGQEPGAFGGGFAIGTGTAYPSMLGLVAGAGWSCAKTIPDGRLACWGANSTGQQATGTFSDVSGPQVVSGVSTTGLVAGLYHACSTSTCWGSNTDGQLGNGSTVWSATPVVISGGPFASVAAGVAHSCGVKDGKAYCWGYNLYGAVGDGTQTKRLTPVEVLSPTP
jgi:alpha-tubulin suppressor-like RCC1 family protein